MNPSPIAAAITSFVITTGVAGQFLEDVETIHVWDGENPADRFGFVNRVVGDVDSDGVLDVGVASPLNSEAATNAGRVYIYSGATGELIREHFGGAEDYFGYELAGVGDVSGDGVDDYVVGAPESINFFTTFGPGKAFLYSGATGVKLHTWQGESAGDGFGAQVVGGGNVLTGGVGDIDNDGTPDILISALLANPAGPPVGRVYVYSGADWASTIHVINGEASVDLFGFALGGLGDLDGDGHGEFIVGAPDAGAGDRGRAYVYDGATGTLRFPPLEAETDGAQFGLLFASGPGDVSGDGVPDILVTDLSHTALGPGTGRAYVYSGVDASRLWTFTGEAAGAGFGVGRGCGDVDFDGLGDFVISSFTSSLGAATGGRTYVLSGLDGSVLRTITGTIATDRLGWSTVGVLDVNDDGALDFMVSSDVHDTGGRDAGRVYVVAGDIFPPPTPGDVDGDGDVDFTDLLTLLATWGPCPPPPEDCPADFDGSGSVDFLDLLTLLANWS